MFQNPAQPQQMGVYGGTEVGIESWKIALDARYIYTGGFTGLFIFEYGYRLGGIVTDVHGEPVSGVSLSAGEGDTTTTGLDGLYGMANLDAGNYVVQPDKTGYAFYPLSRNVRDARGRRRGELHPLDRTGQHGLAPRGPQLTYTDTQGLPTWFDFPQGMVGITMTVTVTPTVASSNGGLAFAGHAFDMGLLLPGKGLVDGFSRPVTVTIQFSQSDIAVLSTPDDLSLYWWNGLDWLPARETCAGTPPPALDLEGGRLPELAGLRDRQVRALRSHQSGVPAVSSAGS